MLEFDIDICEKLKLHCENGKSLESFCAVLRVSPRVIAEWYTDYPEFREAVDMAPCLELYFWEAELVRALKNKDKETMQVAKSKLDHLAKQVISPLKKNTFSELKVPTNVSKIRKSSGDLVRDLYLLNNQNDESR